VRTSFSPFTYFFLHLNSGINKEVGFWLDLKGLGNKNRVLEKENLNLLGKVSLLEEELKKSKFYDNSVAELGNYAISYNIETADVIFVDNGKFIINKGARAGIKEGNLVVLEGILLGEITEVLNRSSSATLATNPFFKASVITEETRVQGVLSGDFGTILKMEKILPNENPKPGEKVVTSGLDSKFPKGVLVGFIDFVDANPTSLQKTAQIKSPLVSQKIERVAVWKNL